jgi:hypothetical protein
VFIIVPAICVPLEYLFLPETKSELLRLLKLGSIANSSVAFADLTLEEIASKFGDRVAVDLSHLSEDRRRALDESLMAVGADGITDSPPNGDNTEVAFTEKV